MLLAPSANRVYAAGAPDLAAAELALLCPRADGIAPVTIAGVEYLGFSADVLEPVAMSRLSTMFAVFQRRGEWLEPVAIPSTDVFADDLVGIPRYQGKTNEQFTRLMLNVTLAAVHREPPYAVLDPLCGRGTTLSTAWTLGHDAAGVEADGRMIEAYAAFLKTYLKRNRISHHADLTPVRRDGKMLGKRLHVTVHPHEFRPLELSVFTGDGRDSAKLFGRRTFEAIVTDAPYGVVHGSHTGGDRSRSPDALLREAIPVWAEQLRSGGALGIAWNTWGLRRDDLCDIAAGSGLQPADTQDFRRFAHRVDSSIRRDLLIARKP